MSTLLHYNNIIPFLGEFRLRLYFFLKRRFLLSFHTFANMAILSLYLSIRSHDLHIEVRSLCCCTLGLVMTDMTRADIFWRFFSGGIISLFNYLRFADLKYRLHLHSITSKDIRNQSRQIVQLFLIKTWPSSAFGVGLYSLSGGPKDPSSSPSLSPFLL